MRGVTAVGDASPQNLQTVATALLRLPYPALDHFHPLRGPAKTLDQQQLRVRRGTKWTPFRKTTSRGRYTFIKPVEGVYFTSDIDETSLLTCLLIKNLDKMLIIRNKLFFWGDGEMVK